MAAVTAGAIHTRPGRGFIRECQYGRTPIGVSDSYGILNGYSFDPFANLSKAEQDLVVGGGWQPHPSDCITPYPCLTMLRSGVSMGRTGMPVSSSGQDVEAADHTLAD
jgi:hypothetical protein